mmetsp:Transcript_4099/g.11925  ORF Transcript_4099/g.11925 Transcript_4099/m.11925 type:complete len:172 (+) Transcript_4099:1243-1758(+)
MSGWGSGLLSVPLYFFSKALILPRMTSSSTATSMGSFLPFFVVGRFGGGGEDEAKKEGKRGVSAMLSLNVTPRTSRGGREGWNKTLERKKNHSGWLAKETHNVPRRVPACRRRLTWVEVGVVVLAPDAGVRPAAQEVLVDLQVALEVGEVRRAMKSRETLRVTLVHHPTVV